MLMNMYLVVKALHVISATILFGTGLGIAFFTFRSHFTDDVQQKLYAIRTTVLADYLFTAPAAVVQPLSGAWLVWKGGFEWSDTWLLATYAIYILAALCWLPVVWIQIELKKMLVHSVSNRTSLPERYHSLFRVWFILGWPAFIGLAIVFFLMVAKPV